MSMKRTPIKELLQLEPDGRKILVQGWVRSRRDSGKVSFVVLNDGSTIHTAQVVVDEEFVTGWEEKNPGQDFDIFLKNIQNGACISVIGNLVASEGKGQKSEIKPSGIKIFGTADQETYPMQKKGMNMETLREIAHLRVRGNTFSAVFRVRHAAAFAVHQFFNDRGFFWAHTPIITCSDTEGAGEMFSVTSLPLENIPKKKDTGEVDFAQDFFGKHAHLTVSGQLNGELLALGLGQIYTFGPTFRAENSNTTRHLAEFWMIEPEVAFNDDVDNAKLAEDFVKYVINYVLETCRDDIDFFNKFAKTLNPAAENNQLIPRLEFVLKNKFKRVTYTEAVEVLINCGKKFEYPVSWGTDLQSEHERYLVEEHYKKPVILVDYPKDIKAFYMKLNEDGKTVRAMDVLFPGIGEMIGGSQREEDLDKLVARIKEMGLNEEDYWWYLETRKFGTAPHSGFGLGFERMLLFLTGMGNIRDVIPFPRSPKNANF